MIRVANKRRHVPSANDVYVGRPSALGNRWSSKAWAMAGTVVVATRDEAVDAFEAWLYAGGANEPAVQRELQRIARLAREGDVTLICWCAPHRCHAEVIRDYVEHELLEKGR